MKNIDYKNLIIIVLFMAAITVNLMQIIFAENEDRTRLETKLVNVSTNKELINFIFLVCFRGI